MRCVHRSPNKLPVTNSIVREGKTDAPTTTTIEIPSFFGRHIGRLGLLGRRSGINYVHIQIFLKFLHTPEGVKHAIHTIGIIELEHGQLRRMYPLRLSGLAIFKSPLAFNVELSVYGMV